MSDTLVSTEARAVGLVAARRSYSGINHRTDVLFVTVIVWVSFS